MKTTTGAHFLPLYTLVLDIGSPLKLNNRTDNEFESRWGKKKGINGLNRSVNEDKLEPS